MNGRGASDEFFDPYGQKSLRPSAAEILARAAYPQRRSSNANSLWGLALAGPTRVVLLFQIHGARTDSGVRISPPQPRSRLFRSDDARSSPQGAISPEGSWHEAAGFVRYVAATEQAARISEIMDRYSFAYTPDDPAHPSCVSPKPGPFRTLLRAADRISRRSV